MKTQSAVFDRAEWEKTARFLAQEANEHHFSSRRGVWHLEHVDKLCVYNNNPYAQYPDRRSEETATFRRWLKMNGIKELAYATYPETREDGGYAGYTDAMILDAGADGQDEIAKELRRILVESWK